MMTPRPVPLKKNLRNRIINAVIMCSGSVVLAILLVMFWLPDNIKELAVNVMLGFGLLAGFSLFGLEEESTPPEE